jgi:hypothetical protein
MGKQAKVREGACFFCTVENRIAVENETVGRACGARPSPVVGAMLSLRVAVSLQYRRRSSQSRSLGRAISSDASGWALPGSTA